MKWEDEINHDSKQARGKAMVQCGNIDSFACNISDIINYAIGQYVDKGLFRNIFYFVLKPAFLLLWADCLH